MNDNGFPNVSFGSKFLAICLLALTLDVPAVITLGVYSLITGSLDVLVAMNVACVIGALCAVGLLACLFYVEL